MSAMRRAVLTWLLVCAAAGSAGAASDRTADARRLYNQEFYELAIRAATDAREGGQSPDEAGVIIARAHLERFRQTRDARNLAAARDALRVINASQLTPALQAEFTLALAQWMYLDEKFRAAAELFDAAMAQVEPLGQVAKDRVLDWWATAMDQQAQIDPTHRLSLYQRMIDRMETELRASPGSSAAGYWLPAAARSVGDAERAWHSAVAGYVRARVAPDGGAALRADLDRLVTTAIIPERARQMVGPFADVKVAADAMTAEWEQLKTQWK